MTYWVLKAILRPVLRFFYRIRVEGLEHVPSFGPVVMASNHLSFCDSIFLPLVVPRRITFVAKAEYFEDPRTEWFFRAAGQIPMKRGGGPESERALAAAREVLVAGGVLGIYPEGTRSSDGRLYKGHTGVARLALECGVPVLCVAMVGTGDVQPIGQGVPRVFLPVTIRISPPMRFDQWAGSARDTHVLRRITDDIMTELAALSGQEYVDRYATR
jgi:1-acyl-sn-glycerol-3-phosphate acyltransferase